MPSNKPSGGSFDHQRRPLPFKEAEDVEVPSSTLWVGSLSLATVDSDLMGVFAKHGALDCTTMHGARSYSFLYFRTVEEARAAKEALQGTAIQGSTIRIEFARPAKAAKQIWVGGFSSSITKEQLEDEFLKFGKIEDYKFFRDRNSAIIEYYKLEDAIAAHKTMNGKRLAGEQLRIDFVRFQPPRRDWPDLHDLRNRQFDNRNLGSMLSYDMRIFHDSNFLGSKRHMPPGGRRDGPPSKVLWIAYPPSVQIDEHMLHNAMILFGEIERIKCFPSRHYSFVEFRSVDEARRAKEGLQGRLFNDPRIQILFSSSEFAPGKDNLSPFPGLPSDEVFVNESYFGPLDLFGLSGAPNSFPGQLHPSGLPGSSMLLRPFGLQGFDPRHSGLDLQDISGVPHNLLDADAGKSLPPSLRHRSPSAPGILPSPPGISPHLRPTLDERDGFDVRESKRSRLDGFSTDDDYLNSKRFDGGGIMDHTFGLLPSDRGASSRSRLSRAIHERSSVDNDYCWRGVIAKGGSHVCHARCIPIGKGLDSPLSDVVNCSARTELEKLSEHYAEAVGFDIVFFLPDSEEDFASYTEFLRYLGSKSRAGVAKLDDGTTLFLVPPSDFLTKVLKVNGPERLYGVVLKFPQQSTSILNQKPEPVVPSSLSQYAGRLDPSNLQRGYTFIPPSEVQASKVDYDQSMHEEAAHHPVAGKSLLARSDLQRTAQSSNVHSSSNSVAKSNVEVSLTPELLATLASLIPSNTQSSTVQMPSVSTMRPPTSSSSFNDLPMSYLGGQEHQAALSVASLDLPGQFPQHSGPQFSNQAQLSQFPTYSNIPSGTDHNALPINGSLQIHNPSMSIPQAPAISTMPLNNYGVPQIGQFSTTHNNQHFQFDASSTSHNNYGMLQTTNAGDVFTLAAQQQPKPNSSFHDQIAHVPQSQVPIPLQTDRSNIGFTAQGQQLQSVLPGSAEGTSQGDADKNQRYQSTLQFAANLLLQLQQQQQAKSNAAQGSGNQP